MFTNSFLNSIPALLDYYVLHTDDTQHMCEQDERLHTLDAHKVVRKVNLEAKSASVVLGNTTHLVNYLLGLRSQRTGF